MIERVTAVVFSQAVSRGKTRPAQLVCEKSDGSTVEVIAKFSAGCEAGVNSLARELVAACLAAHLALPIPQPFLVEIPDGFDTAVTDPDRRAIVQVSNRLAFGSQFITGGYMGWVAGRRLPDGMRPMALAIFVFDALTANPDRHDGNANCVFKGDECRIFDHELCFFSGPGVIIGWRAPWTAGGLDHLRGPGKHIFRRSLLNQNHDFSGIRDRWLNLSDEHIKSYEDMIPIEWKDSKSTVAAACKMIRDVRNNIDGCLTEIKRVLT